MMETAMMDCAVLSVLSVLSVYTCQRRFLFSYPALFCPAVLVLNHGCRQTHDIVTISCQTLYDAWASGQSSVHGFVECRAVHIPWHNSH